MNIDKKTLFLDNDWTLSKFKKWTFQKTIWNDLMINIKNYITDVLSIWEYEYMWIINILKKNWIQLSEWFESFWVNRSEYFYNTWKNLNPEKYLLDRGNLNLRGIIEWKEYNNIIITGAAKVWFNKAIKYLEYDPSCFDKVYTADFFYNKSEVMSQIIQDNNINIKNILSIWDEKNDYQYINKIWWIWIDVNHSSIYS